MKPSYKRRRQKLTQLRKGRERVVFQYDDKIPLSPSLQPLKTIDLSQTELTLDEIRDQFTDSINRAIYPRPQHMMKLVPLASRGHGKTFNMQQIPGQTPGASSVKVGDMLTLGDREYRVLKSDGGIVCTREWESARIIDPDWKPKLIGATQEHRRKLRKYWFYTLEWDDDAEQLKELGLRVAMVKGHPGLVHEGDWHFVETLREIRGKRDLDGWAAHAFGNVRRVPQGGMVNAVPSGRMSTQQPNVANWPRPDTMNLLKSVEKLFQVDFQQLEARLIPAGIQGRTADSMTEDELNDEMLESLVGPVGFGG